MPTVLATLGSNLSRDGGGHCALSGIKQRLTKQGVKKSETGIRKSGKLIQLQLKAFIARQVFGNNGFYPILYETENTFMKAVEVLNQ